MEENHLGNSGATGCKICQHIKDNDARCKQPALSGELYCRFHVRVRTNVSPEDALYELPVLETEQSVQIALQHTMRALLGGKLSEKKAKVMMTCINTAARLLRQSSANAPKEALLEEIATELRGRMASSIAKPPQTVADFEESEPAVAS